MKVELLPNEILIECFEYLNASDIFYSFDQLNYRFNNLIRNIPLYLNFQDVRKSIFDQFCKKMLANPQIQKQIYTLRLSNKNTHGQIQAFLRFFSLHQFSHLRSLTLIDVKADDIEKLDSMLPSLSQLICFRVMDSRVDTKQFVSRLPVPNLQILSVPTLNLPFNLIDEIITVKSLTLSFIVLNKLCQFLRYTPMLQYLNASNIRQELYQPIPVEICFSGHYAVHLKHLIMIDFECDFDDLTCLVKHTPNVKSLTISIHNGPNMLDASRWEQLITTSLLNLNSFQFKFSINHQNEENNILNQLKQFQTDFWQEKHHWYTEYSLSQSSAFIYTIPYLIDSKRLPLDSVRYCNKLVNNVKTFENVTQLPLSHKEITKECQYYFSNITSLMITSLPQISEEYDEYKFVQSLKSIVNLSNVKHLNIIVNIQREMPSILLEILKEAPDLSSLSIGSGVLKSFLHNHELCRYLKQMIKTLYVSEYWMEQCKTSEEIKELYEIFPNIEQLSCTVNEPQESLLILNKLSKLSCLTINLILFDYPQSFLPFKDKLSKLNVLFYYDAQHFYDKLTAITFGIWTDGNNIN